ncbi:transmembrane protein 234 homolog [Tribolium castaneum]|uniref:Transmembrane protein 234 homolog-like Protein n=1 Tax=Tribolium castaneum TaxID=7070 RepID=A0A139WK53_TRICA|nr:PREDICTED: transmembrane protein 234 homolog isoform X4 [Tribolium castaneum]KYB28221.1 Transmembrane protein 234 homolog-like Protein [Tribolium castaneum]|eukprot:XP_008199272.1 PREDICTED: transmembrane protein 234 homolog isoform X4 [Tribolium castaneum]
MIYEAGCLICVAILWGGTNPFLKKNSKEITTIKADSAIKQFFLEIKYLFTNTRYLIPMALNQMGSILYFLTLQRVDLSLSVPVANSLTFAFTALSGLILGEKPPKRNTILGVLLILAGTSLCCYDNYLVRYKL